MPLAVAVCVGWAAAAGALLRIAVGIHDPFQADGTPVNFAAVVEDAAVPIIPGVRYLKVYASHAVTPLAHAIHAAGCREVVGIWLAASLYADCTPATIAALAERDVVTAIDLDQF